MSLMAGFDIVTEISNETITKLIKKNLQIGGQAVTPPFEITVPITGPASGSAHMIVTDLVVDLNADDTMTLTLTFEDGSVVVTSPFNRTIYPLAGSFTIKAAIQLVNGATPNTKQLSVNLGAATTTLAFTPASTTAINNDLNGTGINAATFATMANSALGGFVHSIPNPTLPVAFTVVPGSNGSLAPSLVFEDLKVHCIHHADRAKQALGLFGILLAANHGNGNVSQKTSTAIAAANNGICISLSPGTFRRFAFCPAISQALGISMSNLPTACGSAGSVEKDGVQITQIKDTFHNGFIAVNGKVQKSGFCYDANGSFSGKITLSVSGTTLTPSLQMDEPDVDVDIPWYCYLAAGVVLGPIGLVIAGVIDGVADGIAESLASDALKNALGAGLPNVSLGGLSGASFSSVQVTTEGMTLQGTVPVFVPSPATSKSLSLSGSVVTTLSEVLSSGTWHAQVWCQPEAKDYPYTEYAQHQKGTYALSSKLTPVPLAPEYRLNVGGNAYPLTGNSGTISIPNVQCHYPMPLATGGTAVTQTVHVGYSISGSQVTLTNDPVEGNYSLYLYAKAKDPDGAYVKKNGVAIETWKHVQFQGNHVAIGGGYSQDVQECAAQMREWLKGILQKYVPKKPFPDWPPVNYPNPEEVIIYIRDVMGLGIRQADAILLQSKIAHGSSFHRALLSPQASRGFKLQVNTDARRVAELGSQIESLAGQIKDVSLAQ